MPKKSRPPSTEKNETSDGSDELTTLRNRIDSVDDDILRLLNNRADLAKQIGTIKARADQKAYAPARERALLDRLIALNDGPLPAESIRLIYKEVISACLALESPLRVAFLGPDGTFTHAATKHHFGLSAQLHPKQSISDVFTDVERDRCDYGVIPIENSTEGVVNHTLDAFMASDLSIIAEVILDVSHHLVALGGNQPGITKVYSHPQALAQCRGWLEHNLPGVPLIDVSSTARAAQLASEDSSAAAVASDLAANIHGLQIVHSNVEDLQGNMTRFLVIGSEASEPTQKDRTSVMFALKDAPGVLYKALSSFSDAGINLSRIESRPSRQRAWEYLFFIDLVGHRADKAVCSAIESLQETCVFLKVLGSYPKGEVARKTTRAAE